MANLGTRPYDHVDSEALDRLVAPDRSNAVSVTLPIHAKRQYIVHVHEDGRLVVRRAER
nr:HalOD1 output domain-containing protein [Natronolimnohabitans innermongolicus]